MSLPLKTQKPAQEENTPKPTLLSLAKRKWERDGKPTDLSPLACIRDHILAEREGNPTPPASPEDGAGMSRRVEEAPEDSESGGDEDMGDESADLIKM